ncbi:hypothetical protein ACTFIT_004718 [Dictyostelium discoideum]
MICTKCEVIIKSTKDKHTENVNSFTEEFKELIKLLPIIEIDKIKQLVKLYDEHKDINTNISTIIHDNLNNIDLISNKYKHTINQIDIDQIINNNSDQHNEILNIEQVKDLIKEIFEIDNSLSRSIPNSVECLYLLEGFNQAISEIPKSVSGVYLYNTPLTNFPYSKIIYEAQKINKNSIINFF